MLASKMHYPWIFKLSLSLFKLDSEHLGLKYDSPALFVLDMQNTLGFLVHCVNHVKVLVIDMKHGEKWFIC